MPVIEAVGAAVASAGIEAAKQAALEAARNVAEQAFKGALENLNPTQQMASRNETSRQLQQMENFRVGENLGDEASDKYTRKQRETDAAEDLRGKVEGDEVKHTGDEKDLYKNCPESNGHWEGERGESKFVPDADRIPSDANGGNPEHKTMGELNAKHGVGDGVDYKNGEPDFSKCRQGEPVEIQGFSDNRGSNFAKADMAYADRHNLTNPSEQLTADSVKQLRAENGLTWHERRDCKTMELVPQEIHGNYTHSGGVSEIKERMAA